MRKNLLREKNSNKQNSNNPQNSTIDVDSVEGQKRMFATLVSVEYVCVDMPVKD
jgi:hypothetical protein